jgi:preprotein translocase subunit YajC
MQLPAILVLRAEFRAQEKQPPQQPTNDKKVPTPQGSTEFDSGNPRGGTQAPAGATGPGGAPAGGPSQDQCFSTLLWMLPFFLLLYFLMIRPQQKQARQHQELLKALKKGDRVVTSGGIHGTIASLDEKTLVLRVDSEGNRLTIDRSAVGRVVVDEPQKDKAG